MKNKEFILSEKEYQILSHFIPEIKNYDYSGGFEDLGDIDSLSIPLEKIELIDKIKSILKEYRILRSYEFSLDLFEDDLEKEKLFLEIRKEFGNLEINQIRYEYLNISSGEMREYYSIQIQSNIYQDREDFYNFLRDNIE